MITLNSSRRKAIRSSRRPQRVLGTLALISLGGTWAGCAGDEGVDLSVETPEGTLPAAQEMTAADELAQTSSSLTAAETLCTLANSLKNVSAPGGTVRFSGDCTPKEPGSQTFYNGSSNNDLTAFTSQPFLMNSAYFCALAEAHDARASAIKPTKMGNFGVDSRIVITERNPTTGRVRGQRIGTVYLFGAAAKLEVQNFEWRNFQEQRAAGSVLAWPAPQFVGNAIGYHNRLSYVATDWGFNASGSWPLAGPLSFEVFGGLQQRADYASRNNNNVSDPAVANIPEFSFASYKQRCEAGMRDFCLSGEMLSGALRLCGDAPGRVCTPDDLATGTNKVLPYDGSTGGSAGPFVFKDTVPNWFHYGKPGAGVSTALPGEPVFDIPTGGSLDAAKANSTTHFNVGFGVKFNAGLFKVGVSIQPSMGLRDGLSLRQAKEISRTEFADTPTVVAALDAEASLKLDVPVTVEIPLAPDWSTTFHIIDTEAAATTKVSRMKYYKNEGFNMYEVRNTAASNPTAALQACMAAPTTRASESPDDAARFVDDLRTRAVDNIHPCKLTVCQRSSGKGYKWDKGTRSLVEDSSATCPTTCLAKVSLCGADDQVLKDTQGLDATATRNISTGDCAPR